MCYTNYNLKTQTKEGTSYMNSVDVSNELHQLLTGNNVQTQLSVPQLVEKY